MLLYDHAFEVIAHEPIANDLSLVSGCAVWSRQAKSVMCCFSSSLEVMLQMER